MKGSVSDLSSVGSRSGAEGPQPRSLGMDASAPPGTAERRQRLGGDSPEPLEAPEKQTALGWELRDYRLD